MSIQQIEYVLAIVQYGSLRKAAFHLCCREPTISQQVNKLEKELGIVLFHHSRQFAGLELTEDGKRILPALQRVVEAHKYVHATATAIKIRRQKQESTHA